MIQTRKSNAKIARPAEARALQNVLLGFFALVTLFLLIVYLIAPEIYVQTLTNNPTTSHTHPLSITLFLTAILSFVTTLVFGVLRRWRWVFWLVMIAFNCEILVIPSTILELAGILPINFPTWYALSRVGVSIIQVVIGIWMIRIYRRSGVWAMGHSKGATVL